MHLILSFILLLQVVGTPIPNGTVVVSNEALSFPPLPDDITPTPINDDWELLYYRVYASSSGYQILGELRNTSDQPLSTPMLVVSFANESEMYLLMDIDRVNPGGRVPFNESVYEDEATIGLNQSQEVTFVRACDSYRVTPPIAAKWQFENVQVEFDPDGPALKATGSVTNVGFDSVEGFTPMVFGFLDDGYYAGNIQYGDASNFIAPEDTIEFDFDHGYGTFYTDEPFVGAETFVVGMAEPVSGGHCPFT